MAQLISDTDDEVNSKNEKPSQIPKYMGSSQDEFIGNNEAPLRVSLTLSLFSFLLIWWIPGIGVIASIIAIIFGHKAREIRNSGNPAGIVCGYIALSLSLLAGIISALLNGIPNLYNAILSNL